VNWISVSDRLPDDEGDYWCAFNDPEFGWSQYALYFDGRSWLLEGPPLSGDEANDIVSHWMPWPPPPDTGDE